MEELDRAEGRVITVPPGAQVLVVQATAGAVVTRADGTIKED